ncbi:outer membrane protein assembly factor BamB family protein [Labilibaculum euxinus]
MKLINIFFVAFSSLLLVQCKNAAQQSEWRGPHRNGIYSETNLLKVWPENGPEILWKFEDLGLGYSSAAVTDEKVYTTGTIDSMSYIFSFDLSGNLIWKKEYGKEWSENFPGGRSTPQIYDGKGYLLTGLGKLICFDAEKGDFIWCKNLFRDFDGQNVFYGITENLLIDGDKLICTPGGVDANVIVLHKDTGDLIWKSAGVGEKSAYCSPLIIAHKEKKYLITNTAKSLISIDPDNGKLMWSYELKYPHGIHGNTPIYKDGYVFTMNGWGFGSVMLKIKDDGQAVEKVWTSGLFDLEHGGAVLIDENLFGTDYTTKSFSCVDMKTGEVKKTVKDMAPGTVIAADGMIYCYAYSGELALIQPMANGFEVVSRFHVPGMKRDHIAHPVIKDGKMYIRYANGMYVYSIANT